MRSPKSLETLADHGIIQEVLRPLMSGKEAQIYMVVSDDRVCAAKIYKESQNRSFKHRTDYTEGRKVRNSRDQRAMAKGSKYGKSKDEDAWRTTEVDMIYRLRAAGVRVPEPYVFIDGVLVMELVCDWDGNPAPRLGDVAFTPEEATQIYHLVLQEVVRMLSAGVVHGDLSDFNVLLAHDGPVVIDFPQSVEAAGNLNARRLLLRDVDNLHRFLERHVPGARRKPYGEEIWSLYENNRLTPDTQLTGSFKRSNTRVDTSAVLELIGDANRDEQRRRDAPGAGRGRGGRVPTDTDAATPMRRREIVIEKPAARGARTSHRGPGSSHSRNGSSGAGQGHSGGAARSSDRGRPERHGTSPGARFGRDGQRHSGDRGRGPGARGTRGGPDQRNKTGPKRGDGVQNSAYVSPEARKVKPLSLTPRDGAANEEKPRERAEGRRNRRGAEGRHGERSRVAKGNERDARSSETRPESRQRRARRPRSSEGERGATDRKDAGQAQSADVPSGDRRARARARRDERMNAQGREKNGSQSSGGTSSRAAAPKARNVSAPDGQESAPRRRRRRPRSEAKASSGSTD